MPHAFGTHPAASFTGRGLFGMLSGCVSFRRKVATLSLFTKANDVDVRLMSQKYSQIVDVRGSHSRRSFVYGVVRRMRASGYVPVHNSMFGFVGKKQRRFSFVFTSPPCSLGRLRAVPRLVFGGGLLGRKKLFMLRRNGRGGFRSGPRFVREEMCKDMGFSFFEWGRGAILEQWNCAMGEEFKWRVRDYRGDGCAFFREVSAELERTYSV